MARNDRKSPGDGSDGLPPSEAWLFAQAIMGKPVTVRRPEEEARAKREQLEWLARISPRHELELRAVLGAEEGARHDRDLLEWLARISPEHDYKLRQLLQHEADIRERWARAERFAKKLQEADWDPSKHPRGGNPENRGEFSSAGGGGETASRIATEVPRAIANHAGTRSDTLRQVSVLGGVGHHWAPVSVIVQREIRQLLSDEAVAYAMGSYSGGTDPPHGNKTYGGITHPKYNALVNDELKKFIKNRKIKKMPRQQNSWVDFG